MGKETSTNNLNKQSLEAMCPMLFAIEQINGRWKILLLYYISLGAHRFGKLKQVLPNITTKMLSQQLRELEADDFLTRTVFAEVPPRVEYELTAKTKSLLPILYDLKDWGQKQKKKAVKELS